MRTYGSDTYFGTQAAALIYAEQETRDRGYNIQYADYLWTEHVNYGTSVKYQFPLYNFKRNCRSRKWVHINLYRMDSGNYELTYYIN